MLLTDTSKCPILMAPLEGITFAKLYKAILSAVIWAIVYQCLVRHEATITE